jgi:hypothetical protein
MATRSAIAIRNSDATYDVIYCHWDGYPSRQLPILKSKYNTAKLVRKLLAPGDLSSLETEHDWDRNKREPSPLYYMDRGDLDCKPRKLKVSEMHKFATGSGCEHLYVYLPRLGWRHEEL